MVEPTLMFTVFFVALGPLKALGPFVQQTRGLDEATSRRLAFRTFLEEAVVVAGGLMGSSMLDKWNISIPAMSLAGGIIFFLIGIRQLLAPPGRPRSWPYSWW